MKRAYLIMAFLLSIGWGTAGAQNWSINSADYEFSMNVIGKVQVGGQVVDQENAKVGAFVSDQCVGVAHSLNDNGEFVLYYLTIYSNESDGDSVDFRFMDNALNVTSIDNSIVFASDKIICTADDPFIWMDTAKYASTDFLAFSVSGQLTNAVINNEQASIYLDVGAQVDRSRMIADFELAPGARATVNGLDYESGISENDYSGILIVKVDGVDGATQEWRISVNNSGTKVSEENSLDFRLYPNPVTSKLQIFSSTVCDVEILDLHGRSMYKVSAVTAASVNVERWTSGLYFAVKSKEGEMISCENLIVK